MFREAVKKIYKTEIGRWLFAGLVSACLLGIIFLLFRPVFSTIDDTRLRYVYAGYSSGVPSGNYLFCNVIIGSAISWLYRMAPGIPWYVICHMGIIWFGSSAIGKTVYKLCLRKDINPGVAVIIHISAYLSLFCMATMMIHFEITAAVSGTAAVALLLGLDNHDKKLTQYIDMAFSVIFVFLAYLLLKSGLYAVCCYLLVVLLYHLVKLIKKQSRIFIRVACFFAPLALVAVFFAAYSNNSAKGTDEWQEYDRYDDYRVPYWDYPHITYKDDPELFESIGWSEELYNLIDRKMYFIDERFNEESLSAFVEPFSWFSFDMDNLFSNAENSFSTLYNTEPFAKYQTLLALISFIMGISLFIKDNKKKENLAIYLSLLCTFVGTLLLMLFLAVRGRLPLRAWLMCFIPFGIITLFQLLRLQRTDRKDESKSIDMEKKSGKSLMWTAVIAACCFIFLNTFHNGIYNRYTYRIKENKKMLLAEEYCIANEENFYVYDPYELQDYIALKEYKDLENSPLNMLMWGSSYIYTPVFHQQIKNFGYESFYTYNLFDEDVYLIAGADNLENSPLFLLLEKEYPDFEYEIVDEITDKCVVIEFYKNRGAK